MWHRLLIIIVLLLGLKPVAAQNRNGTFDFRYYLNLMRYGAKGLTLDDYKKHASKLGLNLIHHEEEKSELYLVWAQDVTYQTGYMSESYTSVGAHPRCLNLDLTPNGKNRYTPITITLVFPDYQSQQVFWRSGLHIGCQKYEQIEPTDIDATWRNVSALRYIGAAGSRSSRRYIYFYEKDGLYMCTYLF